MTIYKIAVRTIQGTIITFSVTDYKIVDNFVVFKDEKHNVIKRFNAVNCEIQEVLEWDKKQLIVGF